MTALAGWWRAGERQGRVGSWSRTKGSDGVLAADSSAELASEPAAIGVLQICRRYAAILCPAASLIIAAPFSAIMIVGAVVLVAIRARAARRFRPRCSGSPTPDNCRMCGEPTAPADRITSRPASARSTAPRRETSSCLDYTQRRCPTVVISRQERAFNPQRCEDELRVEPVSDRRSAYDPAIIRLLDCGTSQLSFLISGRCRGVRRALPRALVRLGMVRLARGNVLSI